MFVYRTSLFCGQTRPCLASMLWVVTTDGIMPGANELKRSLLIFLAPHLGYFPFKEIIFFSTLRSVRLGWFMGDRA
jgi:hypothetical protein